MKKHRHEKHAPAAVEAPPVAPEPPRAALSPEKSSTPPGAAPALRTDGPTLDEWTKAGHRADKYPPKGYAAKLTGPSMFRA